MFPSDDALLSDRIPNIPFFYLAYRGWSHYRGLWRLIVPSFSTVTNLDPFSALNGSRHLQFLLEKNLLNPTSLPELEQLYAKRASRVLDDTPIDTPPSEMVEDIEQSDDRVLLKMSDAKKIASILDAPELALEAERAIVQVTEQLETQKMKEKEAQSEKKHS